MDMARDLYDVSDVSVGHWIVDRGHLVVIHRMFGKQGDAQGRFFRPAGNQWRYLCFS
jgi:hypothetical protein